MNILKERNVISDDIYKLLKEKYQTDDFETLVYKLNKENHSV